LDELLPGVDAAFARFEETGIPQKDLDRIKTKIEVDFYGNFNSALNTSIALAQYNLFTGDPEAYKKDLAGYRGITRDDIMRVYETYLKDKPAIMTSFVPLGEPALGVEGSAVADVIEEVIVEGEGETTDFDPAARIIENPTPSAFDRTVEPPFGAAYALPSPTVWQTQYANGLDVLGLVSDEIPVINFTLRLDAGRNRNLPNKPALASLTADMLSKGTAHKTTAELEEVIGMLGSTININAGDSGTFVSGPNSVTRKALPCITPASQVMGRQEP